MLKKECQSMQNAEATGLFERSFVQGERGEKVFTDRRTSTFFYHSGKNNAVVSRIKSRAAEIFG